MFPTHGAPAADPATDPAADEYSSSARTRRKGARVVVRGGDGKLCEHVRRRFDRFHFVGIEREQRLREEIAAPRALRILRFRHHECLHEAALAVLVVIAAVAHFAPGRGCVFEEKRGAVGKDGVVAVFEEVAEFLRLARAVPRAHIAVVVHREGTSPGPAVARCLHAGRQARQGIGVGLGAGPAAKGASRSLMPCATRRDPAPGSDTLQPRPSGAIGANACLPPSERPSSYSGTTWSRVDSVMELAMRTTSPASTMRRTASTAAWNDRG